ncbi:hypothetical protein [Oleiharenicola lentus]|uniref:hypothetical protein n=1 Tax=Oleiharenicola lentus TaxID=2508720 RepID=UPI003F67F83E
MKVIFRIVGLLAAASPCLGDAPVYNPPIGSSVIAINGASGGLLKITSLTPTLRLFIGSRFVGKKKGVVTAITSSSITDASGGWSGGQLSQVAAPYFVRFTSGAAIGTWWQISTSQANTGTVLFLFSNQGTAASLGATLGDTFEIVPGDTLNILLGSLTSSMGGPNATIADAVQIHDGTNLREYHYNTTAGQWREGSASFNRGNVVIRPDSGITIIRKATGNLQLQILGSAQSTAEKKLIPVIGATPASNCFPRPRSLASLNVQTMPGFVPYSGSLSAADKVRVFDGVQWRAFNFDASASEWREGSSPFNRNSFQIPSGTPFFIERGSAAFGGSVGLLALEGPYVP